MKSPYVLLSSRIRFSKLFGDGGGEGGMVCLGLTFSSVIGSGLDGVEIFTEGGSFKLFVSSCIVGRWKIFIINVSPS